MLDMPIRTLCLLLILSVAAICFAQERLRPLPTPKRPEARPTPPKFVVGVYMQPPDTFDVWRARGINTLVGYESRGGSISNKDWSDAAAAKGFFYIRKPAGVVELEADARDPNLLAWMHDDEPDVKKPPTDPERLLADYKSWKAVGPNVPVFLNFSGGNVLGGKTPKETYLEYMKSADWFGNDFYAVTGYNRPDWLWKVGAAVDQLREWSGGRPQFAVIECSAQLLSWTPKTTRGVTADEFRAEVWHAVIHGVRGVVYFPQQFGDGFKYDATSQRVALEMSKQNRRLHELGDVLASAQNSPDFKAQAASPLEVGWRVAGGSKAYVIALNFSDEVAKARTIKVTNGSRAAVMWEERTLTVADGAITDDFGPYEVHVYLMDLAK
jgi:hypothetical protein